MRNNRFFLGLMCLIFVLLLVGACTKPQDPTEPIIETTSETSMEPIPFIDRVDSLRVAVNPLKIAFNPYLPVSSVDRWLSTLVFDGLLKRESDAFYGVLSETWTVSEDGRIFEFILKDGLTFHDGGPVTPEDVIFTYEQVMASSQSILGVDNISAFTILDDRTIQFTFNEAMVTNYQVFTLPILSKKHYSHTDWSIDSTDFVIPMGTGPFIFVSYDLESGLTLVANENDWRLNDIVKEVVLVQMNTTDAYEAYKHGEIDIFDATNRPEILNEVKNEAIGTIQSNLSDTFTYIGFNYSRGLLSDFELRKALKLGFDRDAFVLSQWGDAADMPDVLYTSQVEALLSNKTTSDLNYNPEQARSTLDDAGWIDSDGDGIRDKNGINLVLNWLTFNDVSWSYNLAETAAAQWRSLGIDVRITYVDYRTMLTQLETEDYFDLWSVAWEMPGVSTPEGLFGSNRERALYNYGSYSNTEADAIFEQLNQATTQEERKRLYDDWHAIFVDDLPLFPISQLRNQWVFGNRLSKVQVDSMQSLGDVIRQIEFGGTP